MIKERLQAEPIPESFATRQLAAETTMGLRAEVLSLGDLELQKLQKINEFLAHPEIDSLIDEGKITLGIVKPQANDGRDLPATDEEAAEKIKDEVGQENIIFSFSTQLTPEQVTAFYGDVIEQYSQWSGKEPGTSVWDEIREFGHSGPLTFMLLYRDEGNAVQWWRERMGKTRANEADPNSIRGKHAIQANLPNNLTHGSDSVTSVKKEVGILRSVVTELQQKALLMRFKFPNADSLQVLDLLKPTDEIVRIKQEVYGVQHPENHEYEYIIEYRDENGKLHEKSIFPLA